MQRICKYFQAIALLMLHIGSTFLDCAKFAAQLPLKTEKITVVVKVIYLLISKMTFKLASLAEKL